MSLLTLTRVRGYRGRKLCIEANELTLASGEFLALMGPNGAGKSTLLGLIAGDIKSSGVRQLHGRCLTQWNGAHRARHIGVLPQASELSFPFSVAEVVGLGLMPLSLSQRDQRMLVSKKMHATDTGHLKDRLYSSLSGGERQRVHLARVLVQLSQAELPPLLLLDEPTSAQDIGHQHHVLTIARDLAHDEGFGVICILHDLNQALSYADQCAVVATGVLKSQGNPKTILSADAIEQYWGYKPEIIPHPSRDINLMV